MLNCARSAVLNAEGGDARFFYILRKTEKKNSFFFENASTLWPQRF